MDNPALVFRPFRGGGGGGGEVLLKFPGPPPFCDILKDIPRKRTIGLSTIRLLRQPLNAITLFLGFKTALVLGQKNFTYMNYG